jgi:hypothetical protein
VTVFCRSGHRAAIAASILDGAGRDVRLVSVGGASKWPEPLTPAPGHPRGVGAAGSTGDPSAG